MSYFHRLTKKCRQASDADVKCNVCDQNISEPCFYMCERYRCRFSVHETCLQIKHPFHSSHPLILRTDEYGVTSFICNSCHKESDWSTHYFSCDECDFYMDVKCVGMPPITCDDSEHIQHFTHQHPMPLVAINDVNDDDDDDDDDVNDDDDDDVNDDDQYKIKCFACRLTCSGQAYGCRSCEYYLHKSCAELPLEIQHHPFHLLHDNPLSLHIANRGFRKCKLCKKDELIFSFKCPQCDFELCVTCATRQPIKFTEHEHPLYFLERIYTDQPVQCDAYDTYCNQPVLSNSKEFHQLAKFSSIFRCADCHFQVHLLCGLLPSSIKYKWHIHPLTLFDSVIEDDYEDHYCDVCESERNPRIRVYFCKDCKYTAHIHCLASEIIKALKGDLRDVKLKTVGEDFWKLPEEIDNAEVEEKEQGKSDLLTLKDLIHQLSEDELELLGDHFDWDEENKREQEVSERTTQLDQLGDENIDELLRFSSFTESQYIDFIYSDLDNGFYSRRKFQIKSRDLELKTVNVHGYSIPFALASVMKYLIHKHRDISRRSSESQAMKSIIYFFVCKAMKKMHTTSVIDITKDLLQEWFSYIRFAGYWLDDLGFLEANLEENIRAFFFVQLSKLEMEVPTIVKKKITDLQDELQKKIQENNDRLERCKKFCESSSKQEVMNKLMKLKWKTADHVGLD